MKKPDSAVVAYDLFICVFAASGKLLIRLTKRPQPHKLRYHRRLPFRASRLSAAHSRAYRLAEHNPSKRSKPYPPTQEKTKKTTSRKRNHKPAHSSKSRSRWFPLQGSLQDL